MKSFIQYQPTKIVFGSGCINRIGKLSAEYGKSCLLVTYDPSLLADAQKQYCEKIIGLLSKESIHVENYYGALPNPTAACVDEGVEIIKKKKTDLIVAVGGGSVIDTAKMISFKASNPDFSWEQLFAKFSNPFPKVEPKAKSSIPLIAVPTTSGTGSQVTQAAVITTDDTGQKTGIFHSYLYPRTCFVDPELMISVPPQITADTGFDAFSHAFESYISDRATPFSEILSLESIRLIVEWLPRAVKDGSNIEARENMAFAETLAGKSLSIAGASLPHPLGEEIGSMFPNVPHGRSMAVIYPEFVRFAAIGAVEKFATVGRIFSTRLNTIPDQIASVKMYGEFEKFLRNIGMWFSLDDLQISASAVEEIPVRMAPVGAIMSPRAATEKDLRKIFTGAQKR